MRDLQLNYEHEKIRPCAATSRVISKQRSLAARPNAKYKREKKRQILSDIYGSVVRGIARGRALASSTINPYIISMQT